MDNLNSGISSFLKWSCRAAARPTAFILALLILTGWLIYGFYAGFSNTWLLIINTVATINASLMVFIIQNTQSRESKALHLKIDELLYAVKEAENEMIAIEEKEENELEVIRKKLRIKKEKQATAKPKEIK